MPTPLPLPCLMSHSATSSLRGGVMDIAKAEITTKHVEAKHRQLALVAKELRMVIEIQNYLETGSVEGLMAVLKDLGGA